MPARKPAGLIERHDTKADRAERETAESAYAPKSPLPYRPPCKLDGHQKASAVWRRMIRLYGETQARIATLFDQDALVDYCLLEEQADELDELRAAAKKTWVVAQASFDQASDNPEDIVLDVKSLMKLTNAVSFSFDMILNTVAAPHNLDAFTSLLKRDGTMALVGAPSTPHPSPAVFNLVFKRRAIDGSLIGGIPETQEMLDFCAKHGITSDIEMIKMQDIETAYARMLKSDVKYRFVIDMASLKNG